MTRIVFMGTPDFAVPALTALLSETYDVVGVLTRPDQPAGRGQQMEESPVKKAARANGVPVLQPQTLRSPEIQAEIAALAPDVIVVAAYGLIVPQAILDLPPHGCLNIHGSLLPRWRGASPITAAILAGDRETGVSLMRMEAGLDSGPVIAQRATAIGPEDTTGTLTLRLAALGAAMLIDVLPGWLAGDIPTTLQDDSQATYAPRLAKSAGEVDWGQPAAVIERQVRAFQPWPSAYTSWRGQRLKIIRARAGRGGEGAPGQVVGDEDTAGVVTGDGTLWLDELQLAGKRILAIDVFLRGAAGFVGSHLPS